MGHAWWSWELYTTFSWKMWDERPLAGLSIDFMIILKLILEIWIDIYIYIYIYIYLSDSGQGVAVGFCQHGNGPGCLIATGRLTAWARIWEIFVKLIKIKVSLFLQWVWTTCAACLHRLYSLPSLRHFQLCRDEWSFRTVSSYLKTRQLRVTKTPVAYNSQSIVSAVT